MPENSVTNIDSTADLREGLIFYKDLYTLVKNFLKKEKILKESEKLGLDYKVLTQPTFEFLLKLKKALTSEDGKPQKFKKVFKQEITIKVINETL